MTAKQIILKDLEPLFEKAESEGLWFNCMYQDLWFSPEELKALHKENRFIWSAVNWKLRDPQEKIKQLENQEFRINNEKNEFLTKIKLWKMK